MSSTPAPIGIDDIPLCDATLLACLFVDASSHRGTMTHFVTPKQYQLASTPRHPIGRTMTHCATPLNPCLPFGGRRLPSAAQWPTLRRHTILARLFFKAGSHPRHNALIYDTTLLARLFVNVGYHRRDNGPLCDATLSSLAFSLTPVPIGVNDSPLCDTTLLARLC